MIHSPSPNGLDDVETTKVAVTMPAGNPELPLPEDTQQMLETARQMVEEATKLDGGASGKGKRKVDDMVEDDEDDIEDGREMPLAKRARVVEVELRKERILRRSIMGVAGSLLVGYVCPVVVDRQKFRMLTSLCTGHYYRALSLRSAARCEDCIRRGRMRNYLRRWLLARCVFLRYHYISPRPADLHGV